MHCLLVLLLLACDGGKDSGQTTSADGGATDGGATDGGSDGGSADGGTGDGGTGDGGSDGGTTAPAAVVSGLSWSLDDDIGSIGIVSWTQDEAVDAAWVEFRWEDEDWRSSPEQAGGVGPQSAHVLGVPFRAAVSFRVVNRVGEERRVSAEMSGATNSLPVGLDLPIATLALPDALDPATAYLLLSITTPSDEVWKLIIDRQARIVWAHKSKGSTGSMQVSVDGSRILWDDRGSRVDVHRMSLDGTIEETVELQGMHHSFIEASDRALIWGGTDAGREVVRERSADGSVRLLFDCTAWWAANGANIPCDGNTVTWLPDDDTIYFSSDNETTIVHIDRASATVLATWGTLSGSWAFAEGSSLFYKQHSPRRTPEGNLLLSSWVSNGDHTMVAREYSLDAGAELLTEVWTCDTGSGIRAEHGGETRRLDNGNTLLNYGPGATLREYTDDCELVWEARWPDDTSLRRMSMIEDLYALL